MPTISVRSSERTERGRSASVFIIESRAAASSVGDVFGAGPLFASTSPLARGSGRSIAETSVGAGAVTVPVLAATGCFSCCDRAASVLSISATLICSSSAGSSHSNPAPGVSEPAPASTSLTSAVTAPPLTTGSPIAAPPLISVSLESSPPRLSAVTCPEDRLREPNSLTVAISDEAITALLPCH